MKTKLLLLVLIFSTCYIQAQNQQDLANKYLNERGELAFTFTATNWKEVKELSSIISFDHGQDPNNPFVIKAIANKKNFQKFLKLNLPFTVDKKLNEPKEVVMFDPKIHKNELASKTETYTLSFPLSAYPTYAQYAQQMADFAADHSAICELVDIGGTVQGDKRLLFIKLSDNVSIREQEPRVMYTSSMHGDEIAGFPSMLNLIDYFITAYNDTGHSDHTRVKNLLDNSEVWINPLANPDATYWLDNSNESVANSRRENANNIDLNRNYPDSVNGLHPDGEVYQTETINFMTLAESTHFVLSANFHGGTEVINYPWDNTSVRHPDDSWYFLISKEYAVNCQNNSPSGYMEAMYTGYVWPGVTNGSDWYTVYGGRQDYMNYERHAKELTIELSDVKTPPSTDTASADEIIDIWNYNQEAYIEYLIQGIYGFQGVVKDAISGDPIVAKITLIESSVTHDSQGSWVETELPLGDFYRPIDAGTYDILFEADCYNSFTLTNQTIADYQTIILADVSLTPVTATIPTNLIASSITTTTATLGWDDVGVSSYDIQYRVNGTSTWTSTSSSTNTLDVTALTLGTTYEFQVRSVCLSTPSSYSSSTIFTTAAVSYCTSVGTLTYATGVTLVSFNTISNADGPTKDNGYEDFTNISTNVVKGTSYDLTVNVNTGGNYKIHAFAWIDFNKDGDFNDAGETFDLGDIRNKTDGATSGSPYAITIPAGASLGETRMRVSARYNADPTSCDPSFDGEVEDYTLVIDSSLGIEDEILSGFQLFPNPSLTNEVYLNMPATIYEFNISVSNMLGQKVYSEKVNNLINNRHTLQTGSFKAGIYFVTVKTELGQATKKLIIQ